MCLTREAEFFIFEPGRVNPHRRHALSRPTVTVGREVSGCVLLQELQFLVRLLKNSLGFAPRRVVR
jgi:hypothetical protein